MYQACWLGFGSFGAMAENECSICQDVLDTHSSETVWLRCAHAFHKECMATFMEVKEWTSEAQVKCPNCRLVGDEPVQAAIVLCQLGIFGIWIEHALIESKV